MSSWEFTERKLKAIEQHFTATGEVVWNSFMNKRVTINSNELLLRESNEHASVAYNSIGMLLARRRFNTTSSDANLPTLLYSTLNALKKYDLAFLTSSGIHGRSFKMRNENSPEAPIAKNSRWRHIRLAIKPSHLGNHASQIKTYNGSLLGSHVRSFRIVMNNRLKHH